MDAPIHPGFCLRFCVTSYDSISLVFVYGRSASLCIVVRNYGPIRFRTNWVYPYITKLVTLVNCHDGLITQLLILTGDLTGFGFILLLLVLCILIRSRNPHDLLFTHFMMHSASIVRNINFLARFNRFRPRWFIAAFSPIKRSQTHWMWFILLFPAVLTFSKQF